MSKVSEKRRNNPEINQCNPEFKIEIKKGGTFLSGRHELQFKPLDERMAGVDGNPQQTTLARLNKLSESMFYCNRGALKTLGIKLPTKFDQARKMLNHKLPELLPLWKNLKDDQRDHITNCLASMTFRREYTRICSVSGHCNWNFIPS